MSVNHKETANAPIYTGKALFSLNWLRHFTRLVHTGMRRAVMWLAFVRETSHLSTFTHVQSNLKWSFFSEKM